VDARATLEAELEAMAVAKQLWQQEHALQQQQQQEQLQQQQQQVGDAWMICFTIEDRHGWCTINRSLLCGKLKALVRSLVDCRAAAATSPYCLAASSVVKVQVARAVLARLAGDVIRVDHLLCVWLGWLSIAYFVGIGSMQRRPSNRS
jgi:hypothetical protein